MIDIGLRQYIHHSNTRAILQTLADVVDEHSMIVMYGHGDPATGKSRLLQYFTEDYWRIECDSTKDWHPIVYVDKESLDWTFPHLKSSKVPVVSQVIGSIMQALVPIAERYRPARPQLRWQQQSYSINTAHGILRSSNDLFLDLKSLRVRALLIDDAQSIDKDTLKALVNLRKRLIHNGQPMALIFAARLEKNEQPNEPMKLIFSRAKVDPDDFQPPVELEVLTRDEFDNTVLEDFFADLEVEFEPELEEYEECIAEAMWENTQGDWKSIDRLVKKFNQPLGRRNGTPRQVTREIVENVLKKKLPRRKKSSGT